MECDAIAVRSPRSMIRTCGRRLASPSSRAAPCRRRSRIELLLQIREQELRPGDKLPAERQLAAMMAVSRPVVREALRALALMGVVDIRQGDGTYVTSLEPRRLMAHLDIVFATDTITLGRLLEARRVVETGNARLAARRITGPEVAGLEAIMADLAGAIDDPDAVQRPRHRVPRRHLRRRRQLPAPPVHGRHGHARSSRAGNERVDSGRCAGRPPRPPTPARRAAHPRCGCRRSRDAGASGARGGRPPGVGQMRPAWLPPLRRLTGSAR